MRAAHDHLYSHGAHGVRHAIGPGDHCLARPLLMPLCPSKAFPLTVLGFHWRESFFFVSAPSLSFPTQLPAKWRSTSRAKTPIPRESTKPALPDPSSFVTVFAAPRRIQSPEDFPPAVPQHDNHCFLLGISQDPGKIISRHVTSHFRHRGALPWRATRNLGNKPAIAPIA